ncbi:MAG TPA: MFS transporter [Phycisphaerae bacterium]|jgi:DHA1 family tetracycline resistance protein-like MFS transporter|nr:MFS transporter [Phycisphaerae bacterium]
MKKASLLTLFLIVFIDLIGFGILLPNQQYYGEIFGIHNTFFLVLIGPAYSLCQFLFAPILGKWSDRAGRRPVLILSQVGTLVGFLLLFGAHFLVPVNQGLAIFLLYFSRVLDGISGGNISIASAYIADITTPENRAKGMGVIGAAFGIGFVFGPFIGGLVGSSKHLGLPYVPVAAALFSATALLLTIFTLPESHHPGEAGPEGLRRYNAASIFHTLLRPIIGMLILMSFVNGFAFAGMEQTFSLLIQQRAYAVLTASNPIEAAKAASGACGYLFGGIGIIIAFVQGGFIGRLTKAFGEAALAITGPIIIAAGLVIVGLAGIGIPVWVAFIVGSACLALGSSLFTPSIQSLVSRHASNKEQGEVLGAFQGMASFARGAGPLLAGALFAYVWVNTRYAGSAPYFVSAALCLIVSIWALTMRTRIKPPAIESAPAVNMEPSPDKQTPA